MHGAVDRSTKSSWMHAAGRFVEAALHLFLASFGGLHLDTVYFDAQGCTQIGAFADCLVVCARDLCAYSLLRFLDCMSPSSRVMLKLLDIV